MVIVLQLPILREMSRRLQNAKFFLVTLVEIISISPH